MSADASNGRKRPYSGEPVTVDRLPDDLRRVVEAWDELPEALRAGIAAMVAAACPAADKG